eukprot:gb/GEZN01001643.1/.p1 GENE.gb/GEZN01001643.1/~~gb/GEZN01001643.1/.p1  ORF type:complete len:889 (+),score=117.83 gb/GEZN01001643.1/:153-2819(+)
MDNERFRKALREDDQEALALFTGTELNLTFWNAVSGDVPRVAHFLKTNKTFSTVNLSYSSFLDGGCSPMADCLKANNTITSLDLRSCSIYSEGAVHFVDAFKENKTVTWLDISKNGFSGEIIGNILKTNTALAKLIMRDHNIGPKDLEAIVAGLLDNNTLTAVDFGDNRSSFMRDKIPIMFSKVLKENKTVTSLDLSLCDIGSDGFKHLAEILKENKSLQTLILTHNPGGLEGVAALSEMLQTNDTLTTLRLHTSDIAVKTLKDGKATEVNLSGTNYQSDDMFIISSLLATNDKLVTVTINGEIPVAKLKDASTTELDLSQWKYQAVDVYFIASLLESRRKARAVIQPGRQEAETKWEKQAHELALKRVAALKLSSDPVVRVICTPTFLAAQGWTEYKEAPLGDVFEGHENWHAPSLAKFVTAKVPMSVMLSRWNLVAVASYRWQDVRQSSVKGRGQLWVPANYDWFLHELGDDFVGIIDFVSHRQDPAELPAFLQLMPYLYAFFPVVPQYMLPAFSDRDSIDVALSRGWIFQESALVFLSPSSVQRFVQRIVEALLCNLVVCPSDNPPRLEKMTDSKLVSVVALPRRDPVSAMRSLLQVAQRRMRTHELVQVFISWSKSLRSADLIQTNFLSDIATDTAVTVPGIDSLLAAGNLEKLAPLLSLLVAFSMSDFSHVGAYELGVEALVIELTAVLVPPVELDLKDLSAAQAVLRGFNETEFTMDMDEVNGTLSLLALLDRGLQVPLEPKPLPGENISREQVLLALDFLRPCWHTVIDAEAPFTLRTKRAHAGLQAGGLGYILDKAVGKEERWVIRLSEKGKEAKLVLKRDPKTQRVVSLTINPDKVQQTGMSKDELVKFARVMNPKLYKPLQVYFDSKIAHAKKKRNFM